MPWSTSQAMDSSGTALLVYGKYLKKAHTKRTKNRWKEACSNLCMWVLTAKVSTSIGHCFSIIHWKASFYYDSLSRSYGRWRREKVITKKIRKRRQYFAPQGFFGSGRLSEKEEGLYGLRTLSWCVIASRGVWTYWVRVSKGRDLLMRCLHVLPIP